MRSFDAETPGHATFALKSLEMQSQETDVSGFQCIKLHSSETGAEDSKEENCSRDKCKEYGIEAASILSSKR